jgi:ketosteroid isomerase-like protein
MSRQAIDSGHQHFLNAMANNDTAALLEVLASDVVFYPPGSDPLSGLDAVQKWYDNVKTETLTDSLSVPSREVVITGKYGIESGYYKWKLKPVNGGEPFNISGYFIAIWKEQNDGSWKVVSDLWNNRGD